MLMHVVLWIDVINRVLQSFLIEEFQVELLSSLYPKIQTLERVIIYSSLLHLFQTK